MYQLFWHSFQLFKFAGTIPNLTFQLRSCDIPSNCATQNHEPWAKYSILVACLHVNYLEDLFIPCDDLQDVTRWSSPQLSEVLTKGTILLELLPILVHAILQNQIINDNWRILCYSTVILKCYFIIYITLYMHSYTTHKRMDYYSFNRSCIIY